MKMNSKIKKIIMVLIVEVFLLTQPVWGLVLSNPDIQSFTQPQWTGNSGFTPSFTGSDINFQSEQDGIQPATQQNQYPDKSPITEEERQELQNLVTQLYYYPDKNYQDLTQQVKDEVDSLVDSWISLGEGVPLVRKVIGTEPPRGVKFNWERNGFNLRYNITGAVAVNSITFPITGEGLDKYDSLSFYIKSSVGAGFRGAKTVEASPNLRIKFGYTDENGNFVPLANKMFSELTDIELSGEYKKVTIDFNKFGKNIDWSKVNAMQIYFSQEDIPDRQSATLWFKDIVFVPKEEYKDELLQFEDIKKALQIGIDFNKKWNLGKKEDLFLLDGLRKIRQDMGLTPFNEFKNLKTPKDIIQFSKKYFGETQPASYLSFLLPQSLFEIIAHYTLGKGNITTSLDQASWQAYALSKAGYETYLISNSASEGSLLPKFNFLTAYRDRGLGIIHFIKENRDYIIPTSDINEAVSSFLGDDYQIHKFPYLEKPKQVLDYLGEIQAEIFDEGEFLLSHKKEISLFIQRLQEENASYFQEGVGIDPKSHLPYDNVLLDEEGNIKSQGEYTQPPIIGMYLVWLTGIAKGDVEIEGISREEALRRINQVLETLRALPKWNGLLYNWYKLGQEKPDVTTPLRVLGFEEGYFASSIGIVLGAFIDEENPEAEKIVAQAEEILNGFREGYNLIADHAWITFEYDNENLINGVIEELKDGGLWEEIMEAYIGEDWDLNPEETAQKIRPILKGLIYEVIEDESNLSSQPYSQEIKEIVLEKIQETGYKLGPLFDSLYMDSRAAVVMAYALSAISERSWLNLRKPEKTYTLSNLTEKELLVPYSGAFQAWAGLLFFPEMKWSPQGLAKAHKDYALAQLNYSKLTGLPALFSAASNPYQEENEGSYLYESELGIPGASEYLVRGSNQFNPQKPIATPHAIALLSLVDKLAALNLFTQLESAYPNIKGPLGWRDSIGENGAVSNTYLGLDQLFFLIALNGENNHKYMENFLKYIGKLDEVKRLYSEIKYDF